MAIGKERLNKLIEQGADYLEILQESRKVDKQIVDSMKESSYGRKITNEQYIDRIYKLEKALESTDNPILQQTYREHIDFLRQQFKGA